MIDPFHKKVFEDNIKALLNLLPVFWETRIRTNKHGSGSGDRGRPKTYVDTDIDAFFGTVPTLT
jgi:hypothetical protein